MQRRTLLQGLTIGGLLPVAALFPEEKNMIYELRVYHCLPGRLPDLLTRFRDHTTKLFDRHGLKNVAYWTALDEPVKSNTLFYVLAHQSREAAAANWKSFGDDPEWKAVKSASEANGPLVEKIDSTYLELTDFSPALR